MESGQQRAAVTALIVAAALGVLAAFPMASQTEYAGKIQPVTFVMPEETTPVELADPQAELIVSTCAACHSLDYITTQPRGMGEKFWHDAVTKMVKVYGAPIEPADADAVAEVLAKRFG